VFEELQLDRHLRLGIDALALTEATEVQKLAIPAALQGADLLVSAETGSGKTLAYLIPLAQKILAAPSTRRRADPPGTPRCRSRSPETFRPERPSNARA